MTRLSNIILASGSKIRAKMLSDAGVDFTVVRPDVDEDALKAQLGGMDMPAKAMELAKSKGRSIAQLCPDHITISADQICEIEGRILDKPGNRANAAWQLGLLSGKTHYLHTATCLFQGKDCIWSKVITVEMVMRNLSAQEIEDYVELDRPFQSCGSYEFENNGKDLFASSGGNKDAILGLLVTDLLNFINK